MIEKSLQFFLIVISLTHGVPQQLDILAAFSILPRGSCVVAPLVVNVPRLLDVRHNLQNSRKVGCQVPTDKNYKNPMPLIMKSARTSPDPGPLGDAGERQAYRQIRRNPMADRAGSLHNHQQSRPPLVGRQNRSLLPLCLSQYPFPFSPARKKVELETVDFNHTNLINHS